MFLHKKKQLFILFINIKCQTFYFNVIYPCSNTQIFTTWEHESLQLRNFRALERSYELNLGKMGGTLSTSSKPNFTTSNGKKKILSEILILGIYLEFL